MPRDRDANDKGTETSRTGHARHSRTQPAIANPMRRRLQLPLNDEGHPPRALRPDAKRTEEHSTRSRLDHGQQAGRDVTLIGARTSGQKHSKRQPQSMRSAAGAVPNGAEALEQAQHRRDEDSLTVPIGEEFESGAFLEGAADVEPFLAREPHRSRGQALAQARPNSAPGEDSRIPRGSIEGRPMWRRRRTEAAFAAASPVADGFGLVVHAAILLQAGRRVTAVGNGNINQSGGRDGRPRR